MKKTMAIIMMALMLLSSGCTEQKKSYEEYNERLSRWYSIGTWDEMKVNCDYEDEVKTRFVAEFTNLDGEKFIMGFNDVDEVDFHIVDGKFETFNPVWCRAV